MRVCPRPHPRQEGGPERVLRRTPRRGGGSAPPYWPLCGSLIELSCRRAARSQRGARYVIRTHSGAPGEVLASADNSAAPSSHTQGKKCPKFHPFPVGGGEKPAQDVLTPSISGPGRGSREQDRLGLVLHGGWGVAVQGHGPRKNSTGTVFHWFWLRPLVLAPPISSPGVPECIAVTN